MDRTGRFTQTVLPVLLACLLLPGCAGPSTRVLPRETRAEAQLPETEAVLEEANPFYLREELDILTAAPRAAGSEGEKVAADYIRQLLGDYGYVVTQQPYQFQRGSDGAMVTGINVVAVRPVTAAGADILLVTAHHDSDRLSPGANSAAGVAALLETARLLCRMPTDTELRFVSLSGDGDGHSGTRHYLASLTQEERSRVVGAVQLDDMGCRPVPEMVFCTDDGTPTALGDAIAGTAKTVLREEWRYEARPQGIHSLLTQREIPAVSLCQRQEAYEKGSRFEGPGIVDVERVAGIVNVLSRTLSDLMDPDTPSMLAKSRYYNDLRDNAYAQRPEEGPGFGETLGQIQDRFGMTGTLVRESLDEGGIPAVTYQYPVKWFGVDQRIMTEYTFSGDRLSLVTVDGDGAGVMADEMWDRIVSLYGEPVSKEEGPYGFVGQWTDSRSRTSILLDPGKEDYYLTLQEYEPEPRVIEEYEVREGTFPDGAPAGTILVSAPATGEESASVDPRLGDLTGLIEDFLPPEGGALVEKVVIYTDGTGGKNMELQAEAPVAAPAGGVGAEALAVRPAVWRIDLEDEMTPEGTWRNRTETVRRLLRLYGETLKRDPAMAAAFEQSLGAADAGSDPEPRLGMAPGGEIEGTPDFAECFQWFVLTDGTEEDGPWGTGIGFFQSSEALAAYRDRVRGIRYAR